MPFVIGIMSSKSNIKKQTNKQKERVYYLRFLTIVAAVVNRSRDKGFPGIIHGCAHESTPLHWKITRNTILSVFRICLSIPCLYTDVTASPHKGELEKNRLIDHFLEIMSN